MRFVLDKRPTVRVGYGYRSAQKQRSFVAVFFQCDSITLKQCDTMFNSDKTTLLVSVPLVAR